MANLQPQQPVIHAQPTLAEVFGTPLFKRPIRKWTSKDKRTSLAARVLIPIYGMLTVEAACWCETGEDPDGSVNLFYTISLPKLGIELHENQIDAFEAWQNTVLADGGPLDKFLYPKGEVTTTPGGQAPRLVKRVGKAGNK